MTYKVYNAVVNPRLTSVPQNIFNQVGCCLIPNVTSANVYCAGSCMSVSNDKTKVTNDICQNLDSQLFTTPTINSNTFLIKSISESKCVTVDQQLVDCNQNDKSQLFTKIKDPNQPYFQLENQGRCLNLTLASSINCDSRDPNQLFYERYSGKTFEGDQAKYFNNTTGVCVPCLSNDCPTVLQNYCQNMLNLNDPRCFDWAQKQSNQNDIYSSVCSKVYNEPNYSNICRCYPNLKDTIGDAARCISGCSGGIHCSDVTNKVCGNTSLFSELQSIVGNDKANTFCQSSSSSSNSITNFLDFIKNNYIYLGIGVTIFIILIIIIIIMQKRKL